MENNLLVIFFTGLITGGLTCLAVQGGLLASTISEREQERLQEGVKQGNAKPILFFRDFLTQPLENFQLSIRVRRSRMFPKNQEAVISSLNKMDIDRILKLLLTLLMEI